MNPKFNQSFKLQAVKKALERTNDRRSKATKPIFLSSEIRSRENLRQFKAPSWAWASEVYRASKKSGKIDLDLHRV